MLAILGFLILPLIWSVPEALITAELATTFPENSGYVAWVTAAFGPFWGFQVTLKQSQTVSADDQAQISLLARFARVQAPWML